MFLTEKELYVLTIRNVFSIGPSLLLSSDTQVNEWKGAWHTGYVVGYPEGKEMFRCPWGKKRPKSWNILGG